MSHSISAKKPEGFKVQVIDWNGSTAHEAWYQDRNQAQAAAEYHERLVTLAGTNGVPAMDNVDMSDDDLLRELLS